MKRGNVADEGREQKIEMENYDFSFFAAVDGRGYFVGCFAWIDT